MARLGRYHLRAALLDGGSIRCPRLGEDVDVDACLACTTRSHDGAGCWMLAVGVEESDALPLLPFAWDEPTAPA